MNKDVKALEEALQAGPTVGEWEVRAGPLGLHVVSDIEIEDGIESWVSVASMDELGAQGLADAAYIVACHPDRIRRLLDVNAALLKAVQLYLEWTEAEEDHLKADFYERMEMCRQADQAARAANALALGQ